jgi:hypothetical protein
MRLCRLAVRKAFGFPAAWGFLTLEHSARLSLAECSGEKAGATLLHLPCAAANLADIEECLMLWIEPTNYSRLLLTALLLLIGPTRPAAAAPEEDDPMEQVKQEFGKPNPNAPAALSQFAFLIGNWWFEARVKMPNREWQTFQGTWLGRFILDGYAIADEYRMTDSSGKLIVLGVNLRTYDATKKTWNMKWLHALAGTWVDLGPEELGGVSFDGRSITYVLKEPMAGHAYTRATYTNISAKHFTWRGEKSDDGKAWSEFMVVEVYRNKE